MEVSSPYPQNIDIEDVRECIKNCPEFFEKEEDDLIIFNYRYCNHLTFPSLEGVDCEREKLLRLLKRYTSSVAILSFCLSSSIQSSLVKVVLKAV